MSGVSLRVEGLRAGYGRAEVLHSVSVDVAAGSLVAIIGPNGAGKTTLLNAIMGVIPASGRIELGGRPLGGVSLERRVAAGLCLVPERRELFPNLTVLDNLLLGAFRARRAERERTLEEVLARFPRLRERHAQLAGTLSGGERQMLAMGRALMTRPKLLLLDEPSLGLAPLVVHEVFESLAALRRSGVSMLLVEQNARMALRAADAACVMELGAITAQGAPEEIARDGRLVESYLGLAGQSY